MCPACSQAPLIRIDTTATTSDRGDPMAIVACPSCNWREGWVRDSSTGLIIQLWRGRQPRRLEAAKTNNLSIYERL
jgi:hypothetical protein